MKNFYFEAATFLFIEHQNAAFLDGYCFFMDVPVESTPNGDALAGAQDLCRIFASSLHQNGDFLQSASGKTPLVYSSDGIPRASLRETLESLLCLKTVRHADIWAASRKVWQPDYEYLISCRTVCRGKTYGELRRLRWDEEVGWLLPYIVYTPTQMGNNEKRPLLIVFHGAGGSTEDVFHFSKHHISELAEEKNFLILAVSACYTDSSYGCQIPPYGLDPMDSEMFTVSHEKSERLKRTERTVIKTVEEILRTYPVDLRRISLAGNSMGAMAAFHYAAKYPEWICAIAPSGAIPAPDVFPAKKLHGIPVFFTAGTEDFHGYDYLRSGCELFKQAGVPLTFYTVGGGDHSESWIRSMDLWVNFLLNNVKTFSVASEKEKYY